MAQFNGERLKALRLGAKMTQQELADRAGMHRSRLNVIERGNRQPDLDHAIMLAQALDTTLDYLCELSTYPGDNWQTMKREELFNPHLLNEIVKST